ncbi:MAG TPA: excinuclease ABC subunit UvrC [Chloroflexota bacterium]|nr:excinuclease ABC subunit UvrC [Chloroflexota bacterium]
MVVQSMDRTQLERRLDSLPTRPGVYQFRDASGRLLYVGKAVNLRNRVRSYFRDSPASRKIERMVREIADFEITVVDSELEALILECSLIKAHRPHYNVKLRDDKQYPLIRVTTAEPWPRADIVRHRREDGNAYFGPWADSSSVRNMLALLNKLFPFRTCPREITGNDPRPCLQYHIKRCLGPCIGATSQEEYRAMIDRMCRFLSGRYEEVVDDIRQRMEQAAENLQFERAAYYRDQIRTIEKIMERQRVLGASNEDVDLIAFARDNGHTCVQIFFIRGGRMVERASFPLVNTQDESAQEILTAFVKQFYDRAAQVPPEILIPNHLDEASVIQEWLHRTRGTTVTIRMPRDVEETQRLQLVEENAAEALAQMKAKWLADDQKTSAALGELADYLDLLEPPERIECYDISNTQSALLVASMVVFQNGQPARDQYRRFRIKTVEGPNDFASMQEVLRRRFKRARPELPLGDEVVPSNKGWQVLPSLVIVDGGKGQLSAAWEVFSELGVENVTLVGLAKEREEIFTVGNPAPVILPRTSEALYLVQRIRDEAHRFANTYHRQLRNRQTLKSPLDEVPGIGPKLKKQLLAHLGSLEKIRAASDDELLVIKGMNRRVLASLREKL